MAISFGQRLKRLEASHVRLMTDHEIARRPGEDLDKRIADLVIGIGEFIGSSKSTK